MPGEIQKQYIGARYVPKLADPLEWTTQRTYEAFEMVIVTPTTYPPGSYISRKPVPRGILITNTDYWAFMGSTTTSIAQLQQKVNSLDTIIANTNDAIARSNTAYDMAPDNTIWFVCYSPGFNPVATSISQILLAINAHWSVLIKGPATFTGTTRFQDVCKPVQNMDGYKYRVLLICGSNEQSDPHPAFQSVVDAITSNLPDLEAVYAYPLDFNKSTTSISFYVSKFIQTSYLAHSSLVGAHAKLCHISNEETAMHIVYNILYKTNAFGNSTSLHTAADEPIVFTFDYELTHIHANLRKLLTPMPGKSTQVNITEPSPFTGGSINIPHPIITTYGTITPTDPTKTYEGVLTASGIAYIEFRDNIATLIIHESEIYKSGISNLLNIEVNSSLIYVEGFSTD